MGLGEGTTFPALSALLASWIPLTERSKLGSFVFGGGQVTVNGTIRIEQCLTNSHTFQVGTIAGTLISGYLLHNFEGWHSVFYFFGGVAIIWFIVFVSDHLTHQ